MMLENDLTIRRLIQENEPLQNLMRFTKEYRSFWGFDSEFLASGQANEPSDVHSVQFSDGTTKNSFVIESAEELKRWLNNHHRIKVLYGFVVLPDLGSIEEWLGSGCVK